MRIEDYPPQEPFSEMAMPYVTEVMRRGEGVDGRDIFYGDDPYQGIALHVPSSPNGTVFAFVHGGGWTSGYREHMNFMAPAFTEAGIIFASIGYRLAPQHLFPTGLEDVAAGVNWLSQNVSREGGDPDRLFIGGHSAGGHYTALLAVSPRLQAQAGMPAGAIRGCFPISGVYDFMPGNGMSMRPRFLGDETNDQAASPILNIEGTPPPFLLAHGSKDFPHLITQAERMEQALRAAGGDVERAVLDDRDHFSASFAGGEPDGPWVGRALAWMAAH